MEIVAPETGASAEAAAVIVREMQSDDVEAAGKAYYTAFYVDSLATGVPPSFYNASPESGTEQIESFLALPDAYNVLAVDAAGKVLGGAHMQSGDTDARAIGPVYVSPDESDRGVGKALTRAHVQHAQTLNAPSIRLTTWTAFFGAVPLDAGEMAAAVGISTEGISTRKMDEADVKECAEIFSKGLGYDREKNIKLDDMLSKEPDRCCVATTDDNTILGYTTGLRAAGHTITTSEAAWVAVVSRAIRERWRCLSPFNLWCSLSSAFAVGSGDEARACQA